MGTGSTVYDPKNIHYLAFMGGGGKGMAYCGAIEELERQFNKIPLFPLTRNTSEGFIGVSGASAGAITALLLSLGNSSSDITNILNQKPFMEFFDGPGDRRHQRVRFTDATCGLQTESRTRKLPGTLRLLDFVSSVTSEKLDEATFKGVLATFLIGRNVPPLVASKLALNPLAFMNGLLCDGAVFLGENARNYIAGQIDNFLMKLSSAGTLGNNKFSGNEITFSDLYRLSGVKLVITGTNISNRKSLYFSADHTPDFPVCGAVLISMSIPLVFKPVWVDYKVDKRNPNNDPIYKGLYVDGGVLNNFPLHAFDIDEYGNSGIKKLNTMTLGFRLISGHPPSSQQSSSSNVTPPEDLLLSDILGMTFETLMTPSSEGQVRSGREALQTVDIYSGDLSTLNFDPSAQTIKVAHDYAVKAVMQHMAQASVPV